MHDCWFVTTLRPDGALLSLCPVCLKENPDYCPDCGDSWDWCPVGRR